MGGRLASPQPGSPARRRRVRRRVAHRRGPAAGRSRSASGSRSRARTIKTWLTPTSTFASYPVLPRCHYEHAKAALEAGASVLIEKPVTIRPGDAWDLVATAERVDRHLAVCIRLELPSGATRDQGVARDPRHRRDRAHLHSDGVVHARAALQSRRVSTSCAGRRSRPRDLDGSRALRRRVCTSPALSRARRCALVDRPARREGVRADVIGAGRARRTARRHRGPL